MFLTFGYNAANETNNKDAFLATYKGHLASRTVPALFVMRNLYF
jgi:hypothetical protein